MKKSCLFCAEYSWEEIDSQSEDIRQAVGNTSANAVKSKALKINRDLLLVSPTTSQADLTCNP